MPPAAPPPAAPVAVWSTAVRLLHWTLAVAVATAWATGERYAALHEAVGWVALAAAALRLLWGVCGDRRTRFSQFVRGPRGTGRYLRDVLRRREPRYVGHNPLGAWMVVALLATAVGTGATGWLFTTDRWWGDARVAALHESLAWALVVLAALHVAGVAFTSLRHRENLPWALLTGSKRAPSGDDVP